MKRLEYYFSKIGYANNTTCVQSTNLKLIQETLVFILEKEGYRLISQPLLTKNSDSLIQKLLSSSYKTKPYLWVIGLSSSNSGWTTIKTSVEDLFCRKTNNTQKTWLSELAIKTNCNTFHHNVQNRHWGVLFETNALGETVATGFLEEFDDLNNLKFYGEPVIEPKKNETFSYSMYQTHFNQQVTLKLL